MHVLLLAAAAANAKQFCTRTVAQCRADYPELLGRIDRDLAPWHDSGITAGMASRRRDELRATNAKLDGYVTISGHHGDNIVKGVGGYHGRAEVVVDFVKAALARHCDVPLLRQPFYYTTSDHVPSAAPRLAAARSRRSASRRPRRSTKRRSASAGVRWRRRLAKALSAAARRSRRAMT